MLQMNEYFFENELIAKTDEFLKCVYFDLQNESITFYHYTTKQRATAISQSGIFQASFIRSTSDPLEFALPMSFSRNWICNKNKTSNYMKNTVTLFPFLNGEIKSPKIRPYFMSMTLAESDYLKFRYGGTTLKFQYNKSHPVQVAGMLLKCHYPPDPQKEVINLLDKWNEEVFIPICAKYSKIPDEQIPYSFFVFMKVANTIALATKQPEYKEEDEVRFALFPKSPDTDYEWHAARKMEGIEEFSPREYLPLKLNSMGITVEMMK
jgi:hypothetical protein